MSNGTKQAGLLHYHVFISTWWTPLTSLPVSLLFNCAWDISPIWFPLWKHKPLQTFQLTCHPRWLLPCSLLNSSNVMLIRHRTICLLLINTGQMRFSTNLMTELCSLQSTIDVNMYSWNKDALLNLCPDLMDLSLSLLPTLKINFTCSIFPMDQIVSPSSMFPSYENLCQMKMTFYHLTKYPNLASPSHQKVKKLIDCNIDKQIHKYCRH